MIKNYKNKSKLNNKILVFIFCLIIIWQKKNQISNIPTKKIIYKSFCRKNMHLFLEGKEI